MNDCIEEGKIEVMLYDNGIEQYKSEMIIK